MIKRSPNSDTAKYALALTIDGTELLKTDSAFWGSYIQYSLNLPDGNIIAGSLQNNAPKFSSKLGSVSQPLTLQIWSLPAGAGVLPWQKIIITLLFVTLCYVILLATLRQILRRRKAENKAFLSAQETRLAHAFRVNALGEMASGLAHELTQPLTAILSQSQAGKHLANRGDASSLIPVLESTITQAKRASAILERMRRWTKPTQGEVTQSSLADAAKVVQALLKPEAEKQLTKLVFNFNEAEEALIRADSVELEQVVFNRIRNALDVVEGAEHPKVEVTISRQDEWVFLNVEDNGVGIPDNIRDRLFEPFITNKLEGTGLGLALCQRLVDNMGGEISFDERKGYTVFSTKFPTVSYSIKEAAQ